MDKKHQATLNPAPSTQPVLLAGGYEFREGDRVIQVKNDYDKGVFNGDVGRFTQNDPVKPTMLVDFDATAATLLVVGPIGKFISACCRRG